MENIKDLQALITKRAERRLNNDLSKFLNDLTDHKLFKPIEEEIVVNGEKRMILRSFFWPGENNPARNKIFESLLPEYIENESKSFLEKVEDLKNEVNDLYNNLNN